MSPEFGFIIIAIANVLFVIRKIKHDQNANKSEKDDDKRIPFFTPKQSKGR